MNFYLPVILSIREQTAQLANVEMIFLKTTEEECKKLSLNCHMTSKWILNDGAGEGADKICQHLTVITGLLNGSTELQFRYAALVKKQKLQ